MLNELDEVAVPLSFTTPEFEKDEGKAEEPLPERPLKADCLLFP